MAAAYSVQHTVPKSYSQQIFEAYRRRELERVLLYYSRLAYVQERSKQQTTTSLNLPLSRLVQRFT